MFSLTMEYVWPVFKVTTSRFYNMLLLEYSTSHWWHHTSNKALHTVSSSHCQPFRNICAQINSQEMFIFDLTTTVIQMWGTGTGYALLGSQALLTKTKHILQLWGDGSRDSPLLPLTPNPALQFCLFSSEHKILMPEQAVTNQQDRVCTVCLVSQAHAGGSHYCSC